ncbi:hypothetical protein K466DRAFT_311269 [Polyporus arcularius HHB13444]|uniref:Velvet domain-containing protein n=1 Tax=Polyporus arcularius HHB13444 TaxID=1314778 RepID=A0A5C3NXP9_9APHY|nr:hypothetical protein K466DRAFT_311269 [Polyporus arcularius HHB13444]
MISSQGPCTVPSSAGPTTDGGPISFTHGPFAGKTVRVVADEIQKADAGRKFARKDKRALDPPPVLQVRFFEMHGAGTSRQWEEEILGYDDTLMLGMVCQVDLFPVVVEAETTQTSVNSNGALPFTPPLRPTTLKPTSGLLKAGTSTHLSNSDDDIVAYHGNYAIRESSNSPEILAGTLVTTPITIAFNNREVLAYAFGDLAVREEGTFLLRYRVFDVFSKSTDDGGLSHRIPVLASCFGGVFKVWSTRDFPGLSGSTPLTKCLSLYGASVMIRAQDHRHGRKKQKTTHSDSLSDDRATPRAEPRIPSQPLRTRTASASPRGGRHG